MTVKFVKPKKGLKIPKPNTSHLPKDDRYLKADGEEVVWSGFWHRRQKDGDIDVSDVKAKKSSAKTAPEATKD